MSSTELQHVPAPGDDDFMFLSAVSDAPEYGPVNWRHCPATGDGLQVFIGSVATHELAHNDRVALSLRMKCGLVPPKRPAKTKKAKSKVKTGPKPDPRKSSTPLFKALPPYFLGWLKKLYPAIDFKSVGFLPLLASDNPPPITAETVGRFMALCREARGSHAHSCRKCPDCGGPLFEHRH